jgi:hypothetical protein
MNGDSKVIFDEIKSVEKRLTVLETQSQERHTGHRDVLDDIKFELKIVNKQITTLQTLAGDKTNRNASKISNLETKVFYQWWFIAGLMTSTLSMAFWVFK